MTVQAAAMFDLAIIGGGINGCGIARDAAGRGWRVLLCEKDDLAAGTSSVSTKLIHGGLRYLEYSEFRLVREALAEREVLWQIAPHIIWPLRFVLPIQPGMRPRWLLRLGLFLYDHIGGRRKLPPTRSLDLTRDRAGAPLRPELHRAFEYSDCWVQDSRLVVLNAQGAAELGADIRTRTECIAAKRVQGLWELSLRDSTNGAVRNERARVLVNAAGPWVSEVAGKVVHGSKPSPVRLVQGSHIIVPKLYDHDACYVFQNADRRILFAIPYEQDFTLIGTTDLDYHGNPSAVQATPAEIAYLCAAVNGYFRSVVTPEMVVWHYSGVRPLYDDGARAAQAAKRDYVLQLEHPDDVPPLLTVYGGKITTFRRLAEAALRILAPYLPPATGRAAGWTARQSLPGGDFPAEQLVEQTAQLRSRHAFLSEAEARRLVTSYGTRAEYILDGATTTAALGRQFGAGLSEAELKYLVQAEWARTADDVVWRRSKLGLRLTAAQITAIEQGIQSILHQDRAA
ncbi:MAG: glycerol-3-phosphate dehydrogenase [Proteobacteria bacterium]|nr:glycerol-3-phosphate dehydrogenase [Pseudomonadota bacterium]